MKGELSSDSWGSDATGLIACINERPSTFPLASSVRPELLGETVPGVLLRTLPRGLKNNAARDSVQLLFLGGHLCNPAEDSPVTIELLRSLEVSDPSSPRAASLVNASGAGKTHALLCVLQVLLPRVFLQDGASMLLCCVCAEALWHLVGHGPR